MTKQQTPVESTLFHRILDEFKWPRRGFVLDYNDLFPFVIKPGTRVVGLNHNGYMLSTTTRLATVIYSSDEGEITSHYDPVIRVKGTPHNLLTSPGKLRKLKV